MLSGETTASALSVNARKHHRIHPVREPNSGPNDANRNHTIIDVPDQDEDRISVQHFHQRQHSQTSTASSSIDARASDVIKRITSPSVNISANDEILPQALFRRMSFNINMNSLVPNVNSTLTPVNDIASSSTSDDLQGHSTTTTLASNPSITDDCEICYASEQSEYLIMCSHRFCQNCLQTYLRTKILNSCPALIECPNSTCKQGIHPMDIRRILNDEQTYQRYETFMLRRTLQKIPETRWCPYPNCNFALMVEDSRKAVPYECPACNQPFCQRCSQIWHSGLTCESAASQRAAEDPTLSMLINSESKRGNIRPCPRCKSPIEKLDDGSCNHIRCAICGCEFCWLCMKEVDNLHFITPTGCTFYGKQRWSKSKSILFLIGLWLLIPIITLLAIIIGVPILLIFLPIYFTRKFYLYSLSQPQNCCTRFCLCTLILIGTFLIVPFLLIILIIVCVPAILIFTYLYLPQRFIVANFQ